MLDDTYAHTPLKKMFDQSDVYGVAYDDERAARRRVRLGIIGAGGGPVQAYSGAHATTDDLGARGTGSGVELR